MTTYLVNEATQWQSIESEGLEIQSAADIVQRIMAAHWDMVACRCWVCEAGHKLGLAAYEKWLTNHNDNRRRYPVPGDWEQKPYWNVNRTMPREGSDEHNN
jgi:hypothetical protein